MRHPIAISDATPGRLAYELDCALAPTYHDGSARKSWHQLGEPERSTWERNPTPRLPHAARSHMEAAARAMLAALQSVASADSNARMMTDYQSHIDFAALRHSIDAARAAIAQAEAAGITTEEYAMATDATARLDRAIMSELATALLAMWTTYGNNMERHATNGDNTWTDADHAEWQRTSGLASSALTMARNVGIVPEERERNIDPIDCPACNGLGADPVTGQDCGPCHGGGTVEG